MDMPLFYQFGLPREIQLYAPKTLLESAKENPVQAPLPPSIRTLDGSPLTAPSRGLQTTAGAATATYDVEKVTVETEPPVKMATPHCARKAGSAAVLCLVPSVKLTDSVLVITESPPIRWFACVIVLR